MKRYNIKHYHLVQLLLIAFIIKACGGTNDRTEELSGGYSARMDGSISYILPDNIFKEGIYPNVIDFSYNKDFILVIQKPSKKHFVTFLAYDILNRYTTLANITDTTKLSEQEYKTMKKNLFADSSFYRMLSKKISPYNTNEDIKLSKEIASEMIQKSEYYQKILKKDINYWIISHIDEKKYGPLTKEEFFKKILTLDIPLELSQRIITSDK